MLRELKRNHHITYLTLDDGSAEADAGEKAYEYCHELICVPHKTRAKFSPGFYAELVINSFSGLPYFMKKYESGKMKHQISSQLSNANTDVLVCDFLMPTINVPSTLDCASVLFQHNVEAMIWKRHYEVQTNPLKKAFLYGEWVKSRSYEKNVSKRFDRVAAVSVEDTETMQRDYGLTNVSDVPTGVDTEFFRPTQSVSLKPYNLVFTGSMDWLPNSDAIAFFTDAILPRIRESIPEVTVTVVGRNPARNLIEMSKRDAAIEVTGRVDDVRPYIERASAYIVPLRVGGGTRIKIFEALAMEKPLISTTIGAEGLPICNGSELLLADTPETFASAVVRVLKDKELANSLGRQGAIKVRENFGWNRAALKFAEICEDARQDFTASRASRGSEQLARVQL